MTAQMSQQSSQGSKPGLSTISDALSITGNVISNGEIRLDGEVHGDIHCASLVLSENARLEGSAVAEDVVVAGRLIGSVRAVRLSLQAGSHMEGDVLCQTLAIEKGAYFDGKSRPLDDPLASKHASHGVRS